MSKKLFRMTPIGALMGKGKKKPAAAAPVEGQPIVSALTPEEVQRKKLLRKPVGLGGSILPTATSNTLGG